ncbi:hypothetical protein V6N13_008071 [Hibiscus sabdariffa]
MLQQHKKAIGWTITDLKGISPVVCIRKILFEDDHKPTIDAQRRLNQEMKEVVRKEIIKWLDADLQGNPFIAFLMVTQVITISQLHQKSKQRPPSHVHMASMHSGGCHSDCVMLRQPSNDA